MAYQDTKVKRVALEFLAETVHAVQWDLMATEESLECPEGLG